MKHNEIGKSISEYAKEKWSEFTTNPSSYYNFLASLCQEDEVPDDPSFGFVTDVTLVQDEVCELGVTCHEDGTSITKEGTIPAIKI